MDGAYSSRRQRGGAVQLLRPTGTANARAMARGPRQCLIKHLGYDSGMIHPVILSGGSGTRLWPMSRSLYPKQLLALFGDSSLLQQTVLRVAGQPGYAVPLVVANEEHRFIIADQLREIDAAPEALLLEPIGRNTAPAACVAALRIAEREPDALMLVMPSDHAIADADAFRAAVERAAIAARAGLLVTFGIAPERAESGYGSIANGQPIANFE